MNAGGERERAVDAAASHHNVGSRIQRSGDRKSAEKSNFERLSKGLFHVWILRVLLRRLGFWDLQRRLNVHQNCKLKNFTGKTNKFTNVEASSGYHENEFLSETKMFVFVFDNLTSLPKLKKNKNVIF